MLIRAVGAQGIKVACRSAHYGHVVVELPLLSGSDSTQVIAFGLKVLLGCADFVLDKNPYPLSTLDDAEEEIALAISV